MVLKEVIKIFIRSLFLIEVRKDINIWLNYIHNGLYTINLRRNYEEV